MEGADRPCPPIVRGATGFTIDLKTDGPISHCHPKMVPLTVIDIENGNPRRLPDSIARHPTHFPTVVNGNPFGTIAFKDENDIVSGADGNEVIPGGRLFRFDM